MRRIASALLLGSVVLLASWVVAPAAPPPQPAPVSRAALAAIEQAAPVLAQVNAQVGRLRDRLQSPPQFPEPNRDPFRFGAKIERPRPRPLVPVVAPPPDVPPAIAPPLPRLIALIAGVTDGGLLRSAVLAIDDDVQVVKPGDPIGQYVVRSLSADSAELVEPASGATFRISLR